MNWTDVTRRPPARLLRQFAGLCLVFFGSLAAWRSANGNAGIWTLGLAGVAALGVVGLMVPAAIRPVYTGWMIVAFPIGWTVSRIVLGIVFFLVITPIALLFRVIGRDEMRLARRQSETYWMDKPQPGNAARYFRQF